MTLLPFLPLCVEQLGISNHAAIVKWSITASGATFLSAALVAPPLGRLNDRCGRKLMLIRVNLGMEPTLRIAPPAPSIYLPKVA
jgi:MFS family permease